MLVCLDLPLTPSCQPPSSALFWAQNIDPGGGGVTVAAGAMTLALGQYGEMEAPAKPKAKERLVAIPSRIFCLSHGSGHHFLS